MHWFPLAFPTCLIHWGPRVVCTRSCHRRSLSERAVLLEEGFQLGGHAVPISGRAAQSVHHELGRVAAELQFARRVRGTKLVDVPEQLLQRG